MSTRSSAPDSAPDSAQSAQLDSAAETSNSRSRADTADSAETTADSAAISAAISASRIHTNTLGQSRHLSCRDSPAGQTRGICKRTWYLEFDLNTVLQAGEDGVSGVVSQLEALESSPYRRGNLSTASVISFSVDADSARIRGFISGGTMYESSVRKWLTNPEISNLELHPISDRFHDPLIESFLLDSALPGESAIQGRRLRVDTMQASDAPRKRAGGRPPKRPIPVIPPECEVGAGSVPSPPPQQRQLQRGALPAPAPAGAPALPAAGRGWPSPPAAGRGWSTGGAAAAAPPLVNRPSLWGGGSWPQPMGGAAPPWPPAGGPPTHALLPPAGWWTGGPPSLPAVATPARGPPPASAAQQPAAAGGSPLAAAPPPPPAGLPPPPAAAPQPPPPGVPTPPAAPAGVPPPPAAPQPPPAGGSPPAAAPPPSLPLLLERTPEAAAVPPAAADDSNDAFIERFNRRESAGKDGYADSTDSDSSEKEFQLSVSARMDRREAAGKDPFGDSSDEEAADGAPGQGGAGGAGGVCRGEVGGPPAATAFAIGGTAVVGARNYGGGGEVAEAAPPCSTPPAPVTAAAEPAAASLAGSFLSLLKDDHKIRNFNTLAQAELYLYRCGAPSHAQKLFSGEPDLCSARELCACMEWITCSSSVPYEELPHQARQALPELLGCEPNATLNESAVNKDYFSQLMDLAPARYEPPATRLSEPPYSSLRPLPR
jgi:hypothetical protein